MSDEVRDGYKETVIGLLPKDWDLKPLKDACKFKNGKAIDYDSDFEEGNYLVYGSNGPIGSADETNLEDGFIVGRVGAVGEVHLINEPVWVSDNAIQVKVKNSDTSKKYIYYWLNKRNLAQFATMSAQPLLNQSTIKSLPFPFPSLPEQKKIADILSTVDQAIAKTDEIIEKTKELKKGLMQELLTKGIGHDEFKEVRIGVKNVNVPVNWAVKTMEEMAANTKYSLVDGPFGSNLLTDDYREDGEVRLVQLQNIEEFSFSNEEKKYIYEEKYTEQIRSAAEPGDVVLAKMPDPIGRACIIPDIEDKFLVVADVIKFTPSERYDNEFAMYFFNGKQFRDQVESYATGSTRLRLNLSNFKKLDVLVPPLEEQKKIANILSTVDKKIQKKQEKKEKLERLKKGLMQKLLTGKIRVSAE